MAQKINKIRLHFMPNIPEEAALAYVIQNTRAGPVLTGSSLRSVSEIEEGGTIFRGRTDRRQTVEDITAGATTNEFIQWIVQEEEVQVEFADPVKESTVSAAPRPGASLPLGVVDELGLLSSGLQEFFFESTPGNKDRIAVLKLVTEDGEFVAPPTTNFLLQDVNEARAEKFQIVDTFGRSFLFLYGKRPEIYSYSGILLNSQNFEWTRKFINFYENSLRGTRAVEQKARAQISYNDMIREGFILSTNIQISQAYLYYVIFSFTMFITNTSFFGETVSEPEQEDTSFTEITQPSKESIAIQALDAPDVNDREREEITTRVSQGELEGVIRR